MRAGGGALFVFLLLLHFGTLSVVGLESFPGLHADEARFGRISLGVMEEGVQSPHSFNRYTGPLYSILVASSFKMLGPSVFSLRIPGVVVNLVAFAAFAGFAWWRQGPRFALGWLLAVGGSAFVIGYTRVAWEVTALQNACVLAMVAVALVARCDRRLTFGWRWLYAMAVLVGTTNHFIFATLVIAFFLGALLSSGTGDTADAMPTVVMSVMGVTLAALLMATKTMLEDEVFREWTTALTIVWATSPVVAAIVFDLSVVRRVVAALLVRWRQPAWLIALWLLRIGMVWFVVSGLGLGFAQLLTGHVVQARLASLAYPTALYVPALAAALAWVAVVLWRASVGVFSGSWPLSERWLGATLLCWPAGFAMAGRSSTSMRYYLAFAILFLVVTALLASRRERLSGWIRLGLVFALVPTAALWRPILHVEERVPLRFYVGNLRENSAHFMYLEPLRSRLNAEGICEFEGKYFLAEPLRFYYALRPWPCGARRRVALKYTKESCNEVPCVRVLDVKGN